VVIKNCIRETGWRMVEWINMAHCIRTKTESCKHENELLAQTNTRNFLGSWVIRSFPYAHLSMDFVCYKDIAVRDR